MRLKMVHFLAASEDPRLIVHGTLKGWTVEGGVIEELWLFGNACLTFGHEKAAGDSRVVSIYSG